MRLLFFAVLVSLLGNTLLSANQLATRYSSRTFTYQDQSVQQGWASDTTLSLQTPLGPGQLGYSYEDRANFQKQVLETGFTVLWPDQHYSAFSYRLVNYHPSPTTEHHISGDFTEETAAYWFSFGVQAARINAAQAAPYWLLTLNSRGAWNALPELQGFGSLGYTMTTLGEPLVNTWLELRYTHAACVLRLGGTWGGEAGETGDRIAFSSLLAGIDYQWLSNCKLQYGYENKKWTARYDEVTHQFGAAVDF